MSEHDVFELLRMVAVLALVCVAAALATPKGRLPLALRGLAKLLWKNTVPAAPRRAGADKVSFGKRLLAFVLVVAAVILAVL